eukprot:757823-Hanusia_phi.AAC.4
MACFAEEGFYMKNPLEYPDKNVRTRLCEKLCTIIDQMHEKYDGKVQKQTDPVDVPQIDMSQDTDDNETLTFVPPRLHGCLSKFPPAARTISSCPLAPPVPPRLALGRASLLPLRGGADIDMSSYLQRMKAQLLDQNLTSIVGKQPTVDDAKDLRYSMPEELRAFLEHPSNQDVNPSRELWQTRRNSNETAERLGLRLFRLCDQVSFDLDPFTEKGPYKVSSSPPFV